MTTTTREQEIADAIKANRLSDPMTEAITYYGTDEPDRDNRFGYVNPPKSGTIVALIDRKLLTAGRTHELTDDGRALYILFDN